MNATTTARFAAARAITAFVQTYPLLTWDQQDALTAAHPGAVKVARYQGWQCNSYSTYALSDSTIEALVEMHAAITAMTATPAAVAA